MVSIIQLEEIEIPEALTNISERKTYLNMILRKLQLEKDMNILNIKSEITDNPVIVEVRPNSNITE